MSQLLNALQVDQVLADAKSGGTVYLLGAGGCGMSGLGHLLLDLGFQVHGSDLLVNDETRQLQARGARIYRGHAAGQIPAGTLLVAFTSAARLDHVELTDAHARGIPMVRRATLLATLLHRQRGICVAGMHGKTTTSALLAFALQRLGASPSYAVGAQVPQLVPHARFSISDRTTAKNDPWFVAEADESDGTLSQFHAEHAIVLNVDAEHLDHFINMEAILSEFRRFATQARGQLVFCADDARLVDLLGRNPRTSSFGRHPLATFRFEPEKVSGRLTGDKPGLVAASSRFQVWHAGELLGAFEIGLLGEQNMSNATSVIALLHRLGWETEKIAEAIAPFRGAARRQQRLYGDEVCQVYEDYGHHPNEIRVTLRALKTLRPNRLLVAFQPHRFTRTQHLWQEFATCFGEADRVWLTDLYAASEPAIPGVDSGFLANAIRAQGQAVEEVVPLGSLASVVRAAIRPGDLVLFLGAGDIGQAAHQLVAELGAQSTDERIEPVIDVAPQSLCHPESNLMKTELLRDLIARLAPGSVARVDEPLAKRTTLRVGGVADLYVEPESEQDLAETLRFCRERILPVMVLGRGSNLLVRDGGIRGAVVCLAHPVFSLIQVTGEQMQAGAGARLKAVAVEARRHGLSGLEFLEGIPGSLGGAMRMNAGAMGSWLFDVVESIRFMDSSGDVKERRASEVNVEYRGCPLFRDHIALGAVLHGRTADKEAIRAKMESYSRKRWESQPSQPSAGCIFKNPSAIPAGRLIDELGLKGTRVGGAIVSDVHANFIVNDGTATASDVLALIEVIKQRAKSARGIELETEVQILGEG